MIDPRNYKSFVRRHAPGSPMLRNAVCAFVIGGGICTLGQYLRSFWTDFGLSAEASSAAVSVSLIFLSSLLTGLGLYDKLAKIAGAGTLVPITGFANAVVSAAVEFKSEGVILGVGAKMFTIAGPVIVYGTAASVVYGVIYWITTLF